MRSIEHVKRYTTNGMATDQGKMSNMNGLAIAADARRQARAEGRPHHLPPALHADHLRRLRRLPPRRATSSRRARRPIDAWAEEHGAVFEPVALWRRARYFPKAGEDMHAAVARECRRRAPALGIFDASTLGKIEVVGPDAAEFLNRMYTNPWTKLGAGPLPLRPPARRGRLSSATTA